MQIKTIVILYLHYQLEKLKLGRLIMPSMDENVEQLELSNTADGNAVWYNCFEKVSYEVKHTYYTTRQSHCKYYSRNEDLGIPSQFSG